MSDGFVDELRRAPWPARAMLATSLVIGLVTGMGIVVHRDDPTRGLLVAERLFTCPIVIGAYADEGPGRFRQLTAFDGETVESLADLEAAIAEVHRRLADQGKLQARVEIRWKDADGGERAARLPWPPEGVELKRIFAHYWILMVVAVGLVHYGRRFYLRGEPPEARLAGALTMWLPGTTLFLLVDLYWGRYFTWGPLPAPFLLGFFMMPAPVVHYAIALAGEGKFVRESPNVGRFPYVLCASVFVVAAVAAVFDQRLLLVSLLRMNLTATVAAVLGLIAILYASFVQSRRRAEAASRRLARRNRKLEELNRAIEEARAKAEGRAQELEVANEQLRLATHDLRIAMAQIQMSQQHTAAELTEEAAQGRVVSNIAHTFREPLAPIYTFLHNVLDEIDDYGPLADRYGRHIPQMIRRIDGLMRICSVVLEMPQAGIPQNVGAIAREVADIVHRHATLGGKRIKIEVLAGDLPVLVAPKADLFFLLHELATNAARAIAADGRIWIKLDREPAHEGEWLRIELSDNGPGMGPERLRDLFTVYASSNPDGKHGIGLYLVEKVVRRLGGEIGVTSAPGEGTFFVLRLPVGARGAKPS